MPTEISISSGAARTAPRLPMPKDAAVDEGQWKVLVEAIFPAARTPEAVVLALNYCRARGLDPFRRPVHIVPVWNSALGREVETVWPSINELETTAARTGAWAGLDPPQFGPMMTETWRGRRKVNREWTDAEITVTFPEWCVVTVYRMVHGQRCAFAEPVYWREAYGRAGGTQVPNDQWARRPRGMITKVAKAFSLRAAFPEETGYTAEEMEGSEQAAPAAPYPEPKWSPPSREAAPGRSQAMPQARPAPFDGSDAPSPPPAAGGGPSPGGESSVDYDEETGEVGPRAIPLNANESGNLWRDFAIAFMAHIDRADSVDAVEAWTEANRTTLGSLAEEAPKLHTRLKAAVGRRLVALTPVADPGPTPSSFEVTDDDPRTKAV